MIKFLFKSKKQTIIISSIILISSLFLWGCIPQGHDSPTIARTESDYSDRYLTISLTVNKESSNNVALSYEELGGNFTEGLVYCNVSDVSIEIDENTMKLETALHEGLVTESDIFYYARLDAKNGICRETCESIKGLTNFTYCYPEYDLRIIYDILETPDGQQRLISDIGIYPPGYDRSPYYNFFDSKTGERYIIENWGLDFNVKEVSPTGILVNCTQSEGQQIGQLYVTHFTLTNANGNILRRSDEAESEAVCYDAGAIDMGGTTTISIDWSDYHGELPSGNYKLDLSVQDKFDESQVHPLMVDYYDIYNYGLEFSIP